jgi:hypothetical protein
MRKVFFLLAVYGVTVIGCKDKGTGPIQTNAAKDTTHFFQITQFIKHQIEEVKQTPYFIYKVEIKNGNRDSIPVTTPIFTQLAQPFVTTDINNPEIKNDYTENVFYDQTTKTFTISYSTLNKQLEVQNIEVLLQEDGRTVKRVFIRKFYNFSDSSAIEQLSWKTNENFQINRVVQGRGKKENIQQTIVVWNEKS